MVLDHYLFRTNKVLLKACGLWPQQTNKGNIVLQVIIFIVYITNIPLLIAYFYTHFGNKAVMADVIFVTASYLFGVTKISTAVIQYRKVRSLFNQLRTDWNTWSSEPQIIILQSFAKKGRSLIFVYTVTVFASAMSYTSVTLLPQLYHVYVPQLNMSREAYLLPEEYGVDVEENFYWLMLYNLTSVYTNSMIFVVVDTIYMSLLHHTCGLLAAVGDRFKSIVVKYSSLKGKNDYKLKIQNDINFCIKQYAGALKFADRLNDVFSVYFFFMIGINAANLIFASVLTIVSLEKLDCAFRYGNYALLMLYLLFLSSFPAQRLMDCSSEITQNIYSSSWYEKPISFRKSIVFILMRSSQLCTIKIGKFCVLSMETLSSVVRFTVSLCTMLLSFR